MMSDDDRDIDMGSEDDDGVDTDDGFNEKTSQSSTSSTPTPPTTKPMTQAEKRAHHNMLERKRRDHIKDSFISLRDSVPSLHGEKVSKRPNSSRAQILKKAAEYIQFMRRKNSAHQHDIEDLKRQNQILENQIRALERAKLAGGLRAATSGAVGNPMDIKLKTRTSESDSDMDGTKSGTPTIVSVSSGGTVKRVKVVTVANTPR
ncbi:Protein max [Orchesella cincta]|uniref:Protein max n=1 Tax=Orchesella cincta TaxID=48709 RepID=A0A1D2N5Z0_ORCCI|nr:Protein max [Orchesella cincta]